MSRATERLVDQFAAALRRKLIASEQKYGYSDQWLHDPNLPGIRRELLEHIEKGDPLDVAAYCAFLWYHGEPTCARPNTKS